VDRDGRLTHPTFGPSQVVRTFGPSSGPRTDWRCNPHLMDSESRSANTGSGRWRNGHPERRDKRLERFPPNSSLPPPRYFAPLHKSNAPPPADHSSSHSTTTLHLLAVLCSDKAAPGRPSLLRLWSTQPVKTSSSTLLI
jgi:hypothetical protein